MAETAGSLARMAIDSATPFDVNSFWTEFDSEGIAFDQPTLMREGIRGTRMMDMSGNVRSGLRVGGPITMSVTRLVLDNFLPFALGANESSNVFNVAESIPDFYMLLDKKHDIYLLSEGKIGGMTLAGEQNQPVKATFDTEFESYTAGQSWPGTLVQPDTSKPYFFADAGQVTIDSTAREIFGFEVRVDNVLSADQWGTNLTRDELIIPTNRVVTANLTVSGDSANAGLLDHTISGEAVSLVLTSANEASSVITIAFGRLHVQRVVPVIGGKGPVRMQLQCLVGGYLHPGTGSHVPDIAITNAHA